MTANYDKLITVLEDVFMLDKAELDFGIYRIMNQKRADITRFLKQDLIPQVQTILAQNGSGDRKALERQLDDAIKSAQLLGMDADAVPKVKELRAQLADIPDLTALENDVFSGLATFFKRYFDKGDFISMRRYKRDVYAIPYEGEEVKLHWANADQYYIKTAEYLKHYRFRLDDTYSVSFELLEASIEQNNNKSQGDRERRFALYSDQPLEVVGQELRIYFTYEPTDKKRKQEDLLTEAFDTVKTRIPNEFLSVLSFSPTEKNRTRTLLEKHLRDYTARNTFDYFIHKDLGGFLHRELDFFIKNEVLFLDDLDVTEDRTVLAQLAKVRALRQIGEKVIQFLAQLENFQKRLWLKKKFVVESQYCITLDRVPEKFYVEIVQNEAQVDEWVRLFAIDQITADIVTLPYHRPLTVDFLKQNPYLLLDTAFFSEDFKLRLLAELPDLDNQTDGLLINSENFQALNLLQERYQEQIKCVYIDPPYNTGGDGFAYKDNFQHSSWLAMMENRLALARTLLPDDGAIFVSIDDNEQKNLNALQEGIFGEENFVTNIIWQKKYAPQNDAIYFSDNHDFLEVFAKNKAVWRPEKLERSDEQNASYTNPDNDPRGAWMSGDYTSNKSRTERPNLWYPITNPANGQEVWPSENGNATWRYTRELHQTNAKENRVWWGRTGENSMPRFKRFLIDVGNVVPRTLWQFKEVGHTQDAIRILREILPTTSFTSPKPPALIEKVCKVAPAKTTIDFFAGSGTTGHAIINLNREDEGKRNYILVEMGEYFDTVTKPRILKVIYSKDWRNGKPVGRDGISHCLKYIRLESYEDTLNNLSLNRTDQQELALGQSASFREGYILNYMLDVESRSSLLNLGGPSAPAFRNPFACYIDITRQNERTPTRIDLIETFNYLIGLAVEEIYTYPEIRVVTGTTRRGEKTLIIWRNVESIDNAALNEWVVKQKYNPRDREFDRIYVNGDNHLENIRLPDETWKVTLIDEEFRKRMEGD